MCNAVIIQEEVAVKGGNGSEALAMKQDWRNKRKMLTQVIFRKYFSLAEIVIFDLRINMGEYSA